MSKLKIQELEDRIAPSVGLLGFLQTNFPEAVDADGNLDADYVSSMADQAGVEVNAAFMYDSTNVSNLVISDALAEAILDAMG